MRRHCAPCLPSLLSTMQLCIQTHIHVLMLKMYITKPISLLMSTCRRLAVWVGGGFSRLTLPLLNIQIVLHDELISHICHRGFHSAKQMYVEFPNPFLQRLPSGLLLLCQPCAVNPVDTRCDQHLRHRASMSRPAQFYMHFSLGMTLNQSFAMPIQVIFCGCSAYYHR